MQNIGKDVYIADGAKVIGNVDLGDNCSVWYNAVIRADEDHISIGKNTNVQDNAVLHLEKGMSIQIGEGVTIGHGAIVHGCNVGDNTLIGMGAIIMNHAQIGSGCIIGAGALVTEGVIIPDNSVVIGSPAKVRREVTAEELAHNKANALWYVDEAKGRLE